MTMAITFLFLALSVRFLYIQVFWQEELNLRALDQWTREIPVVAERGNITDRNGVVLADNRAAYTVFARANAVGDVNEAATRLAPVLGMDRETLIEKLTKKKVSEVALAKKVDKSVAEALAQADVDGVYYARDNFRTYPKGDSLCQLVGFTSSDNTGLTGLEKYYDKYLSGKNGKVLWQTDLVGVEIENAVAAYLPAERGYDVQLTVDYGIQSAVESALQRVMTESNPKAASCVVLDVTNFEVLALANLPAYDLNDVPRQDAALLNSLTRNRIVCDVYEPGSTFKILTAAIDVEEHLRGNKNAFSTGYVFNSSRTRRVDGTTVKCWSNHANGKHSNQTLADALNNSCNPCFTDIALSIGKETFYQYLSAFGFGQRTGIDFSGEAYGLLIPEAAVRACDLARIGFGQTIAVSPLQLACACASVVNGGYYYTPRLVKRIAAEDGYIVTETEKKLRARTVSEEASALLRRMLRGVVEEGSGKKAAVSGYAVGGKTGTAQKFENGRIAVGKYVSSFVGFFPAESPKYLALVTVDEPQGAYYGSIVAAPVAKSVFESIIQLKNIPPTEET